MAGWKFFVAIAALFLVRGLVCGAVCAETVTLNTQREASTDLAVTGDFSAIPDGATRFISYKTLLTLPQVTAAIEGAGSSADLPSGHWTVTGVLLAVLAEAVGAPSQGGMIEAVCSDGYRGHYSQAYLAEHRPILVLKIDGLDVHAWAEKTHHSDPGPYLVAHEGFMPSYRVLAQPERPQVPSGVVQLNFDPAARMLGAIRPRGSRATDEDVEQGFRIAQQSCFRCHNNGAYGGTKADRSWRVLSGVAVRDPTRFMAYIHAPRLVDPGAKMPGNPTYDAAALAALTAYFQTLASGDTR